jgi:chemotaxis methyl-accepting protein methylase
MIFNGVTKYFENIILTNRSKFFQKKSNFKIIKNNVTIKIKIKTQSTHRILCA